MRMTPTLMAAGRLLASARTRAALSLGVVLAVDPTHCAAADDEGCC